MRDYPPSGVIDQARRDVIQHAAERNEYPPGLPTGRAIPYDCPRGKRHVWEAPTLSPPHVAERLARRNVADAVHCTECGLTRVRRLTYDNRRQIVWWPVGEYYLWMDIQNELDDARAERELEAV